jgi:hypothetical protein
VIILGNLSGFTVDKNPGVFTINGLEAIFNMQFSKDVSWFMNFTYQHGNGKNLLTGISGRLPGIATVKGNIGVLLQVDEMLKINLSGNRVGERHVQRTNH